ncbi:hypothetical protein ACQP3C_28925, partial [Escherichia coli]
WGNVQQTLLLKKPNTNEEHLMDLHTPLASAACQFMHPKKRRASFRSVVHTHHHTSVGGQNRLSVLPWQLADCSSP